MLKAVGLHIATSLDRLTRRPASTVCRNTQPLQPRLIIRQMATSTIKEDSGTDNRENISNVTRYNFQTVLPHIQAALNECTFFAFDNEMTGLHLDHHRDEYLDEPQDRYTRIREAAQAYVITQFGLSCWKALPDGKTWEATTFNAYIFPEPLPGEINNWAPPRRFLSDASSLSFLAEQSFDFNAWIKTGVPYMPLKQQQEKIEQFERQLQYEQQAAPRNEAIIDKPEDIAFVQGLITQVYDWLSGNASDELLLQKMTAFQRLLTYQELARPRLWSTGGEPGGDGTTDPGFFLAKVEIEGWNYIKLVRGNREAAAAEEERKRQSRRTQLAQAAGFSEVMRAMQTCGKPAVCHNGFFDIAYVLATFAHSPHLPPSWVDFKKLVVTWFPAGLYDTKYLARFLPSEILPDGTGLGDVFKSLTEEGETRNAAAELLKASTGSSPAAGLPLLTHAPQTTRYTGVSAGGAAHEAGYDAFMTGAIFSYMLRLVPACQASNKDQDASGQEDAQMQDSSPGQLDSTTKTATAAHTPELSGVLQYCGRINTSRTDMPYLELLGPDQPLLRPHVFHLYGGPPGARINDVTSALSIAGVPTKPRITLLPHYAPLPGFLLDLSYDDTKSWTVDKLAEGLLKVPDSNWKVQSWADYAAAKSQAQTDSMASNGKRRRVETQPTSTAPAANPVDADNQAKGGWCSVM